MLMVVISTQKAQFEIFCKGAETAGVVSNQWFDKSPQKSNVKKYIRNGLV